MIALAVVAWEVLTWGLFYITWANGSGDPGWAFAFGAAAIVGPIVFIPSMSKRLPKQQTFGDRMRRDMAIEAKRRERAERLAAAQQAREQKGL